MLCFYPFPLDKEKISDYNTKIYYIADAVRLDACTYRLSV